MTVYLYYVQIKENWRTTLDQRLLRNNANISWSNPQWWHFQKHHSIIAAPGAVGTSEQHLEDSGIELLIEQSLIAFLCCNLSLVGFCRQPKLVRVFFFFCHLSPGDQEIYGTFITIHQAVTGIFWCISKLIFPPRAKKLKRFIWPAATLCDALCWLGGNRRSTATGGVRSPAFLRSPATGQPPVPSGHTEPAETRLQRLCVAP